MKKIFEEYYQPSIREKNKMWNNAIFIFDANILLNLYQYSETTRKEFLGVLNKLNDRIWLPHQFALEYQRKRLDIIEEQINFYKYITEKLTKGFDGISNEIKKKQQQHPFLKIDDILNNISCSIKETEKEIIALKNKHPNWIKKDPVRDHIDKLFKGKVGLPCDNKEQVEKIGLIRFDKKIPPGYKDSKKDYPYGDWIGWYQIKDMVSKMTEKKSIILITNDNKDDWWLKINHKTIGPRPELIKEILDITNGKSKFYMYTMETFFDVATTMYKIKPAAVEEINEMSKQERINFETPTTSGIEQKQIELISDDAGEQSFTPN